jgi:hypothetical protein
MGFRTNIIKRMRHSRLVVHSNLHAINNQESSSQAMSCSSSRSRSIVDHTTWFERMLLVVHFLVLLLFVLAVWALLGGSIREVTSRQAVEAKLARCCEARLYLVLHCGVLSVKNVIKQSLNWDGFKVQVSLEPPALGQHKHTTNGH